MFGGSAERLSDPEQKPNASADENFHDAKTGRPAKYIGPSLDQTGRLVV